MNRQRLAFFNHEGHGVHGEDSIFLRVLCVLRENLLAIPNNFSVPLLQLDPRCDPLRKLPRYAHIVQNDQQPGFILLERISASGTATEPAS